MVKTSDRLRAYEAGLFPIDPEDPLFITYMDLFPKMAKIITPNRRHTTSLTFWKTEVKDALILNQMTTLAIKPKDKLTVYPIALRLKGYG